MTRSADHLVLGAGLSGLTLALELRRAGVRGTVAVLDHRTAFGRDRTWCSWEVRPHVFDGLVTHRWTAWEVVTPAGAARHEDGAHAYARLDSRDVYAHALAALDRDEAAEVHLGVEVLGIDAAADPPRVRTSAGDWTAGRVYDGLALTSPRLRAGEPTFTQSFLGWEVETDRPAFDPGVATLMDFRVPQDDGLRFLYVLPFSRTRALVEDTTIARGGPADGARRALLDGWLRERAGAWTVHHEERGAIPMTAVPYARPAGPRVHPIGTGAGAVRPSSGYAFARIQRHCRAVAEAVARGDDPPATAGALRPGLMDRVFLQALEDDPAAFPERFRAMVAGTSPEAFARFMTDEATVADELRMVAALPKRPFLAAAARALGP